MLIYTYNIYFIILTSIYVDILIAERNVHIHAKNTTSRIKSYEIHME